MLKQDAVGWSHKFIKRKCTKCGVDNKVMLVQTQKRIKLGPLKLINLGPRGFGRECYSCGDLTDPTPGDLKTAEALEYYFRRDLDGIGTVLNDKRSNRKYPILDDKTRELIIKDNRKEGMINFGVGILISLIASAFFDWWYWIFIVIGLLSIYAFFEDPELKHRAHFEKEGKVFDGTKTSRLRKGRSPRSLK